MYNLKWAKVRPTATIPTREDANAGMDIYADFENDFIIIHPSEVRMIPTGIASSFDNTVVAALRERSSTGICGMKVNAGVIDSNFRGEWQVVLNNTSRMPIIISKSECLAKEMAGLFGYEDYKFYDYKKAIAQVLFLPIIKFDEIEEISYDELKSIESDRGCNMLGSSGK